MLYYVEPDIAMKWKLRDLINASRRKEELILLPSVSDGEAVEEGRWTAKDHLAHLAFWRHFAAEEMTAVRTEVVPRPISDNFPLENARIFERTHLQRAALIRVDGQRSWEELTEALFDCSEGDLVKISTRRPTQRLWHVVYLNTVVHLATHLGFWYVDRGDDSAAEQAAKWGHDLTCSTFSNDRMRAAAAYNLGCFYAGRGQAEKAAHYLQIGIQLRPDLHELAKQDTDLDPIRSSPQFQRIVG
jgi:hypothetical protein